MDIESEVQRFMQDFTAEFGGTAPQWMVDKFRLDITRIDNDIASKFAGLEKLIIGKIDGAVKEH